VPSSRASRSRSGEFIVGVDGGDFVLGLDLQQAQQGVGEGVDAEDDGLECAGKRNQWRAEEQCGGHRGGQGDVLGHHLTEEHVQVRREGQGDDEGDGMDESLGHADGVEGGFQQVGDGRLSHRTENEGGDGDAELGGGHHR
jgi:hypothetical protein